VSTAKAAGYDANLLQEVLNTNDRIAGIRAKRQK
jgi:hypothetical protein